MPIKTTCKTCGIQISVKRSLYKETGNYCSKNCYYKSGSPKEGRKNGTQKICIICGTEFYASKAFSERKYCNIKCKGVASRLPNNTCKVCGKEFKPRMGCKDQPCCSLECGHIYRRKYENKNCETCGKEFYPGQPEQRFCSIPCANEWQSRNKLNFQCKICGEHFLWSPSRVLNNNIKYCSLACRDKDPDRAEQLARMNAIQQTMKTSSIEKIGYEILDEIGIPYFRQHVVGKKFCVDAFVPSSKLVIQFDGDYWHGNTEKFPVLDARQMKRVKLDASQDAYMKACGYRVLRIWEHVLNKERDRAKHLIQSALVQPLHNLFLDL